MGLGGPESGEAELGPSMAGSGLDETRHSRNFCSYLCNVPPGQSSGRSKGLVSQLLGGLSADKP